MNTSSYKKLPLRDPAFWFFAAGILLILGAVIYSVLYYIFDFRVLSLPILQESRCALRTFTGFYCPACGGTRAVLSLARFQLIRSFLYNPFPLYVALIYANFWLRYGINTFGPQSLRAKVKPPRYRNIYVILIAVVILGNWIVRNVLLLCGISTL